MIIELIQDDKRFFDMSFFERFLTLWVALCIVAGVALGQWFPGVFQAVAALEVARPLTRAGSLDERERPWKVFFDLSVRF